MRSASTKAVNLAAKPFLNRRPVIRVAALVWVLAIGLSALNLWRYGDFFRTASSHRSRLAALEGEIANEEARHLELRKRVEALELDEDNSTATFLNGLIHQRVFPWSRLFDDMENMLPKDVYLTGLAPQIEKVERVKVRPKPRAGSRASRAAKAPPKPAPDGSASKDIDRVSMSIEGYSRTDDAMLELVDRLYASPTFLDPVLSSEKRDQRTGLVHFSIDVIYLTRAQQPSTESAEALAAEPGAIAGDGAAGATLAETVNGAPGAGAGPNGVPAAEGEVGAGRGIRPGAVAGPPGVFGQPAGAPPAGQPGSRPGFGGTGGPADPVIIQPGFNRPDLRQGLPVGGANGGTTTGRDGGAGGVPGGIVVPPRRPPTGLNPVPSATPGLRGGG